MNLLRGILLLLAVAGSGAIESLLHENNANILTQFQQQFCHPGSIIKIYSSWYDCSGNLNLNNDSSSNVMILDVNNQYNIDLTLFKGPTECTDGFYGVNINTTNITQTQDYIHYFIDGLRIEFNDSSCNNVSGAFFTDTVFNNGTCGVFSFTNIRDFTIDTVAELQQLCVNGTSTTTTTAATTTTSTAAATTSTAGVIYYTIANDDLLEEAANILCHFNQTLTGTFHYSGSSPSCSACFQDFNETECVESFVNFSPSTASSDDRSYCDNSFIKTVNDSIITTEEFPYFHAYYSDNACTQLLENHDVVFYKNLPSNTGSGCIQAGILPNTYRKLIEMPQLFDKRLCYSYATKVTDIYEHANHYILETIQNNYCRVEGKVMIEYVLDGPCDGTCDSENENPFVSNQCNFKNGYGITDANPPTMIFRAMPAATESYTSSCLVKTKINPTAFQGIASILYLRYFTETERCNLPYNLDMVTLQLVADTRQVSDVDFRCGFLNVSDWMQFCPFLMSSTTTLTPPVTTVITTTGVSPTVGTTLSPRVSRKVFSFERHELFSGAPVIGLVITSVVFLSMVVAIAFLLRQRRKYVSYRIMDIN